ncbi:hypothetical protein F4802DRAFT_603270 [Xylaria palmicola]|nr:hypothetical protein F4802DRAFT_603270 [Xylaria palmicola]
MSIPLITNVGTARLLVHLKRARQFMTEFINNSGPDCGGVELEEQLKDLIAVIQLIDEVATRERLGPSTSAKVPSAADVLLSQSACTSIAIVNQECIEFLEPIQSALEDYSHDRSHAGYTSSNSHLSSEPWYEELRDALKIRANVLRLLLTAIELLCMRNEQHVDDSLSAKAQSLASTLQYSIVLIEPQLQVADKRHSKELGKALAAAKAISLQTPASLNRHFLVPRSIKSYYTGREKQMSKLVAAFADSCSSRQKRLVIYGLGGSGKTELAVKYALDHLQDYWGVFFIDGSSQENASGSYLEIAKLGGVEPNAKAAKNWLATRVMPWLLIIDNADDDEIQVEDMVPTGTNGCVLITSRNPAHKSYGTAVICKALGYLPLALVHAGTAILENLCSWTNYLGFYDRETERIRDKRVQQRNRSLSLGERRIQEDNNSMTVFSSYEILLQSLEMSQGEHAQDAVELLRVFSYLHYQNIRVDIFIHAAMNPSREAEAREKEAKENAELERRIPQLARKSWSSWLQELILRLSRYVDTPPQLISSLKTDNHHDATRLKDEILDRLRAALAVLVKRSLIMKQERRDERYSMHPLVHKWVRERPDMSASQQALWRQTTATILASSILFPPLGNSEDEIIMRRELLPHIRHVQSCEDIIEERLKKNRHRRKRLIPAITPTWGRHQALEAARFSRVFSECGLFKEALELQSKVRDFAVNALGEQHPLAIKVTLFLTGTLYELSRASEATRIQRRVYEVCVESLGQRHPLTLTVADLLGASLCFLGRWSASLALHKKAAEGLRELYGEDHEYTLKVIRNLGRVYLRYMEWEKSAELHRVAWEGMKKCLGETHIETLICMEDLAMSQLRLGGDHVRESHELMTFVLDERERALGKEQPYTLLAICNLGRVKSAMGRHAEAARIMKDAVVIADRNLGEDHFGVLAGKTHYAQVLVNQGRLAEAEEMFRTVVNKPQYRRSTDEDGEHPDRLIALWYLTGCLEKQGKFREALDVCRGLMRSLAEIGGEGLGVKHKFATMVQDEITKVEELMNDANKASEPSLIVPSEL